MVRLRSSGCCMIGKGRKEGNEEGCLHRDDE